MKAERRRLAILTGAVACAGGLAVATLASSALGSATPAHTLPAVTISPLPGTPDGSPTTQVSFLGVPARSISHVVVKGSQSGLHRGRLSAYATGTGVSFLPAQPFTPGETVAVRATESIGAHHASLGTNFTVATLAPLAPQPLATFPPLENTVVDLRSRPDLRPPTVGVSVPATDPASGDLFLTPVYGDSQAGPMIVKPTGQLVWFTPEPPNFLAANLQVQHYFDKPVLTYWEGQVALGHGLGHGVILDTGYRQMTTVEAGNGLVMDMHDFTLGPDGVAYITIYDPVRADLTPYGGPANGIIEDCVVQEIDVRTGLVMFEWHALGHIPVSDSHVAPSPDPGAVYDWFHVNRVQALPNGDLLINGRYTWAAYRVSHVTGAVVWQLGGRHSTFVLGPGVQFAYQHDTTLLPRGRVDVFDNADAAGQAPTASQSRGLLIALDFKDHRATLLQTYVDDRTAILSPSQGSIQTLRDGDHLLGYGEVGLVAQFASSGQLTFAAALAPSVQSYRAFRFPWTSTPAGTKPTAVATRAAASSSTLVAVSWNGATTVKHWQLLAGASPSRLHPVGAPHADHGFETRFTATVTASFVAVRATDGRGAVLATSSAVAVTTPAK